MAKVFCEVDGQVIGPFETDELRALVIEGKVVPDTLVWQEGSTTKVVASSISGLFSEAASKASSGSHIPDDLNQERSSTESERPDDESAHAAGIQPAVTEIGAHSLELVKGQAARLLTDLKHVDFKEEVLPVDRKLIATVARDFVFWIVTALAIVPLLIATIERTEYQLTAFALFFAVLWGVMFKFLVIRSEVTWIPLIASLFFTGIVGMQLLLFSYRSVLPEAYTAMAFSQSGVTRLLGFVFQVGICEELIKIIPVVGYLAWKRKAADPIAAVLVGVFSGLGFAAFENMDYGERSVLQSAVLARNAGVAGAALGTYYAMVNVMLRSLSLVFCHAIWSGIFAYFVTTGFAAGSRLAAMFLIGLFVSAILHGAYDWLTGIQMTFAALVVAGSFVLFSAYLTKLRLLITDSPS